MTEERRQRNAKRWATICNEHENGCFCPLQTFKYCPFGTVGKACSTVTPEDWERWLEGKRMSEDEKRGFQNGCRVILKMMEESGYNFQQKGIYTFANVLFGFVDRAEQDVEKLTELYSTYGYDVIMQAVVYREEITKNDLQ